MVKETNGDFEASLFKTADRLRKNIDAAEYKNVAELSHQIQQQKHQRNLCFK